MKAFHNEAESGQIGSTVLVSGGPLWTKYIVQTYLTGVVCCNRVRGTNRYTGYYKGKKTSVQGSGTGISPMGIYAYELYQNYSVDTIVRIGTAGAIRRDVEMGDLAFAMGRRTNPNFPTQYHLPGTFVFIADFNLLPTAVGQAQGSRIPFRVGSVFSSDVFYEDRKGGKGERERVGVLVQEMETLSLYCTAARVGKRVLGTLTVGSSVHTDRALANGERKRNLDAMIQCISEIT